jgi:hypothetical protein
MGVLVNAAIPDLIAGMSKINGKGVFAGRHFNSGDVIADWTPTFLHRQDELPTEESTALQVGPDAYVYWGIECVDNYVNHSCDPSAAVIIGSGKVLLKAIRPIKPMMEITFDYSITIKDDAWSMSCSCGAKNCRWTILEYKLLPEDVRRRYEYMKIVPAYAMEAK